MQPIFNHVEDLPPPPPTHTHGDFNLKFNEAQYNLPAWRSLPSVLGSANGPGEPAGLSVAI